MNRRRTRALAFAVAVLAAAGLLSACGGAASETGTTPMPGGATPNSSIKLAIVEPDDGVAPVVDLINSATTSIDVGTYEIDPDYAPFIDALLAAQSRGVAVRVMVSRTEFPLTGPQENAQVVAALQAKGLDAQLSNPQFSYYHAKVLVLDDGQPGGKALVSDFNFAPGYFGPETTNADEGGTRGMAALVTDPADVAEIGAYFDADWPPYAQWPPRRQSDLIWSPGADTFTNPGNSEQALLELINGAEGSLDIYEQQIPVDSVLVQPILDRAKAGVKVRMIGNKQGFDPKVAELLEPAGVEIVFAPKDPFPDGKPMYIHTKTIVADAGRSDAVAYLGSVNPFLAESLNTERELGALVTDPDSVARIDALFDRDFSEGTAAP
ncbi:MAG: phosphatidylserine/phosphatidylglycerophosphate/cardiolipin synthase family protein [Candidatus Nanopelagicales bacterium]